jgi:starch synthase
LAETISEYNSDDKSGNGFVFEKYTGKDLIRAVKRALKLYKKSDLWRELQISVMQEDFSWDKSAQNYLDLYVKMHEES